MRGHEPKPMHVLVVDDEKVQRETLATILRDQGYMVSTAYDVPTATQHLRSENPAELILTDFRMPGGTGLDVLKAAQESCPQSITLMMTAYADVQSVLDAMRLGVLDYLIKPLHVESLLRRLDVIRERRALKHEVSTLRTILRRSSEKTSILGPSAKMEHVRSMVEQVSQTRGTVLITGESGTGKEVVAQQIHRLSKVTTGPFVAVNCGALPENLLESELFGHKKGSFTGALQDKQGLFTVAQEGTIFLDEIGEMPKALQVKLLRAIQEREVTPVGDTKPIKIQLRIIAATNRDLNEAVSEGSFRADLYYRINVVEIPMPPLRERTEDIPTLAQHFIEKYTKELGKPIRSLSNEALRKLLEYPWPGNVRELENIIERALILSKNPDAIDVIDLPESMQSLTGTSHSDLWKLEEAVRRFTKNHLLSVLQHTQGDKKEAAKLLGMGLSSLYRKLEELEIPK